MSMVGGISRYFLCVVDYLFGDSYVCVVQQDQKPDRKGNMPYKGLVDCAGGILRKEGPLAFWTGFSAYYGRCAPHAMIILLSIESITSAYRGAFKLD